jgi:hypothetical protein
VNNINFVLAPEGAGVIMRRIKLFWPGLVFFVIIFVLWIVNR